MRVMKDVSAERYWTLEAEMEVESLDAFMSMGQGEEDMKEFAETMKDYHDLEDSGRRGNFNLER